MLIKNSYAKVYTDNIFKRFHPVVCGLCPLLITYPVYFINHSLYLHANTRHLSPRCVNPFTIYSEKNLNFPEQVSYFSFNYINVWNFFITRDYSRFNYLAWNYKFNLFLFICLICSSNLILYFCMNLYIGEKLQRVSIWSILLLKIDMQYNNGTTKVSPVENDEFGRRVNKGVE